MVQKVGPVRDRFALAYQHPQLHLRLRNSNGNLAAVQQQLQCQPLHPTRTSTNCRPHRLAWTHRTRRRVRSPRRSVRVVCNQEAKLHEPTTIHLSLNPSEGSTMEKILLTPLENVCTMNPMKGISLKQHWHCPKCKVSVTTYITLSTPPQHRCLKAANQPKPLQPSEGEPNGQ